MIPFADRLATTTQWALGQLHGDVPRHRIYSDRASGFAKVMRDLFIPHSTSIPGRPETNGIAEGNVQSLSACVRALLEQPGLEHLRWPYACRAAALALNTNVHSGGSYWRKRHQEGTTRVCALRSEQGWPECPP